MDKPEGRTPEPENNTKARDRHKTVAACFCYVVECSDGSYYTGWSTDPERRLKAHNAGRGARYTRSRRPVRLVYVEPQKDQAGAMKREQAIKAMSRSRKERLIHSDEAGGGRRLSRKRRSPRKKQTDGRSR